VRCKGCGYSLWNVPGRNCPECGRGFLPSEFEFRANAVEFCCPGCMQQYYGTDRSGLPEPRSFACVRCGAACDLDAMVLRPAPGTGDADAELRRVPWEEDGKGFVRRFFRTVGWGIARPSDLGRSIRAGSDPRRAAAFVAWLIGLVIVPTGAVILAFILILPLIPGISGAGSTRTGGAAYRQELLSVLGGVAVPVILGVASAAFAVVAAAGIAMLVLRILRVPARWRTTWSAFAYGLGPAAIMAVPYFGPACLSFPLSVWYLVVVAIVLVHALGIPGWKAACAAAAPAVLAVALMVASILVGIGFSSRAASSTTPAAPAGAAASQEDDP
jgi:hypothetical protein